MRILGIDPGYGRLGIAVIDSSKSEDVVLFSSCLETDPGQDFPERLHAVIQELRRIISEWRPEQCAIEKLFFQKNKKTAMRVSETRGAIISLMADEKLKIFEVSPQDIKIAITGNGGANKNDIARFLPKIVRLPHQPTHDDEYDAIATAITASRLSTVKNYYS